MPRLSVIIPHQGDDVVLESTILSVLENRPQDSEIIVVHNGSYSNPYCLQDELSIVQVATSTPVGLLNAGLKAARSPVVCLLCDGATVTDATWADDSVRLLLQEKRLSTVTVRSNSATHSTAHSTLGICLDRLRLQAVYSRHELESQDQASVVAPTISCGFYRRLTLLALGGWNETVSWSNADIELAMLMHTMDLECDCISDSTAAISYLGTRTKTLAEVSELAALVIAYDLRNVNLFTAGLDVLRGLLVGKPRRALAWACGLRTTTGRVQIQNRCDRARERLLPLQDIFSPTLETRASLNRRAA